MSEPNFYQKNQTFTVYKTVTLARTWGTDITTQRQNGLYVTNYGAESQ